MYFSNPISKKPLVFGIVPLALLVLATPFLAWCYHRRPVCVRGGGLLRAKLFSGLCLVTLHILLLQTTSFSPELDMILSVASCEAISLTSLLWVQHQHEARPSALTRIYIAYSTLIQGMLLHSCLCQSVSVMVLGLGILTVLSKVLMLCLHETSKWHSLHDQAREELDQQDSSGLLSRILQEYLLRPLALPHNDGDAQDNLVDNLGPKHSTQAIFTNFEPIWNQHRYSSNGLLKTCAIMHRSALARGTIARLLMSGMKLIYPYLTYTVVTRASARLIDAEIIGEACSFDSLLVFATLLLFGASMTAKEFFFRQNYRIHFSIKSALIASVLKKLTEMSEADAQEIARLDLISDNIEATLRSAHFFHMGWANLAEATICIPMLWQYLGPTTILAIALPIVSFILCTKLAERTMAAQLHWDETTQKRVSGTTEMVQNIKGIKMTNKETVMHHLVEKLREEELTASESFFAQDAVRFATMVSTQAVVPVIVMVGDALRSQNLAESNPAARLFFCLTLAIVLSNAILRILEVTREGKPILDGFYTIQRFLNLPGNEERRSMFEDRKVSKVLEGEIAIKFEGVSFSAQAGGNLVLSDIHASLDYGSFTLVTGPAGAGKSTLLRGVIGQSVIVAGQLSISPQKIGYCGQDLWIQNKTFQENIVGPASFDRAWYLRVLAACLLDIGDQFVVNRAVRQRLAIARAVYPKPPILILDDSINAQDRATATALLSNLFGPDRLVSSKTTVLFATSLAFPFLEIVDQALHITHEGKLVVQSKAELMQARDGPGSSVSDNHETFMIETESPLSPLETSAKELIAGLEAKSVTQYGEQKSSWSFFFSSTSRATMLIWFIIMGCTTTLESFYMWHVRFGLENGNFGKLSYGICLLLTVLSGPCFALAYYVFNTVIAKPELKVIHSKLLNCVIESCSFFFFDANVVESVTNLFHEAMCTISRDLPYLIFQMVYVTSTLGTFLSIIVSLSPLTLVVVCPIPIALYTLHHFDLQRSKRLQRIKLRVTGMIYTHFTETVTGISHINSFQLRQSHAQRGWNIIDQAQNVSRAAFLVDRRLQLALGIFIMMIVSTFVGIATYATLPAHAIGLTMFVFVELQITLEFFLRFSRSQVSAMSCLAEIQAFLQTAPREEAKGLVVPSEEWPVAGQITYENSFISYMLPSTSPVLGNISLTIQGSQEVGLYGPAASGKSSFLYSLLNLVPYTGSIKIDGLEVRNIPRPEFRTRFTVIPQKPVVFSAMTVRQNLIPEEMLTDIVDEDKLRIVIEYILDEVGLWHHVYQHGDTSIPLQDLKLSPGQLQLFSLAQALVFHFVNRSKIVLIDAATSNVDREMRQCMQRIIREIFPDSTLITVANHPSIVAGASLIGQIANGNVVMGLSDTGS